MPRLLSIYDYDDCGPSDLSKCFTITFDSSKCIVHRDGFFPPFPSFLFLVWGMGGLYRIMLENITNGANLSCSQRLLRRHGKCCRMVRGYSDESLKVVTHGLQFGENIWGIVKW